MSLTSENYTKGFLVDEELMGGITSSPHEPGVFVAYVLNHLTGEYLGYQGFQTLEEALAALHSVKRSWVFESVSGCGAGKCAGGNCKVGGCGKKLSTLSPEAEGPSEAESCSTGSCSTTELPTLSNSSRDE
jgi:hypothetical protein